MELRTKIERMADTLLDPEIIREPAFEILSAVAIVVLHRELLFVGVPIFLHGIFRVLRK